MNEWTVAVTQTRDPENTKAFTLDADDLAEALAGAIFQAAGSRQVARYLARYVALAADDPGADAYGDVADISDLLRCVMADGQARRLYRNDDVTCALVIPVPEEPQ